MEKASMVGAMGLQRRHTSSRDQRILLANKGPVALSGVPKGSTGQLSEVQSTRSAPLKAQTPERCTRKRDGLQTLARLSSWSEKVGTPKDPAAKVRLPGRAGILRARASGTMSRTGTSRAEIERMSKGASQTQSVSIYPATSATA